MRLQDKELRGLPVETKSGDKLGKITGFTIDPSSHRITEYSVKPHPSLPKIIEQELLIGADQVLSLDNEKMVVDDLVIKDKETVTQRGAVPA